MTPEPASMCYVGRRACGCVVAAVVDRPEWAKDTRRGVASFLRSGLTIERMATDEVRRILTVCPHKTRKTPR